MYLTFTVPHMTGASPMSRPLKNTAAAFAFLIFIGLGGGTALADGASTQTGGASGCCRQLTE